MNWMLIAGVFVVVVGAALLSVYLSSPAEVDSEEEGAVEGESPRERERALFEDKERMTEAERAINKEVDTWK